MWSESKTSSSVWGSVREGHKSFVCCCHKLSLSLAFSLCKEKVSLLPALTQLTHKTKEIGASPLLGAAGGTFFFPLKCPYVKNAVSWGWRMRREKIGKSQERPTMQNQSDHPPPLNWYSQNGGEELETSN